MAERRPLVLISGQVQELPTGDTTAGATGGAGGLTRFASNVGTGAATDIAVVHGLGTLDVVVEVYEVATGATVNCDVRRDSVNQITLGFAVAPSSAQYRVVVVG